MEPDYIYGVGDEVLISLTLIACVLIPLFAFISYDWRFFMNLLHLGRRYILREEQINEVAPQGMREHLENVGPDVDPDLHVPPAQYNSGLCPICLTEHQLAVETNCGHVYCGNCLRSCIYMNGIMSRIRCPMCRQMVTILFECFTYEERHAPPNSTVAVEAPNVSRMVENYNHSYSDGNRTILDMVRDWPTLMRHLCNEFFSLGGLMVMFRIRIVLCFLAALMYVFSPLDIIPEAVFGVLGLLDDVFVVFLLAIYVSIIYRRLVASRSTAA